MKFITVSGKRRSGKTTLANILNRDHNFYVISLADELKNMCSRNFGLSYDQTDGHLKEVVDDRFGMTPRDMMIKVGKFYRSIHPNYWILALMRSIKHIHDYDNKVYVIPDVRFMNEFSYFKERGALAARLERDEALTGPSIDDPSETEFDDCDMWDVLIPAEFNKDMKDLEMAANLVYDKFTASRV